MSCSAQQLCEGLEHLGLTASTRQLRQVLLWLDLLERWNRVYNLTAIPAVHRIVQLVWLSAAAVPYIQPARVLDVGSGPGVPGIVLAILAPQFSYVLVDSSIKKTRFMRQAVLDMNLPNVTVLHQNIESFARDQLYDTIISRAFACARRFFTVTRCCAAPQARWLTYKGENMTREAASLPRQLRCRTHPLTVPGLEAPITLLEMQVK